MAEENNRKRYKKRRFYGEDSELFTEKKRNSKNYHNDNICDTHIDGA